MSAYVVCQYMGWVFSLGWLLCREMNWIVVVDAALSSYEIIGEEEGWHTDQLVPKMIRQSKCTKKVHSISEAVNNERGGHASDSTDPLAVDR